MSFAGVGVAHFAAVPSSAKVPPATVTADVLVDSSLSNEAFTNAVPRNGSFPVRASERSSHVIDGLSSGEAYDVFFVIEVMTENDISANKSRGGAATWSGIIFLK